jgi:hypothetical protein
VERFVQTLRRYRKLLEEERDEEKRNTIRKLLAEEEAREVWTGGAAGRPDKSKHP